MTRFAQRAAFLAALVASSAALGLASRPASADNSVQLALVAYSTPQEAYADLIKAFQATPAGSNVTFTQSYGASGEQSRNVVAGMSADIVAFSLEPDITKLVTAGLVPADWNKDKFHGMVTDSVVVFVVRKGNPKRVRAWADLIKPGMDVIAPNPFTSGGARWNVMAAYGAMLKRGASPNYAIAYLSKLFDHISVQDKSGRESLQTFLSGKGDVMLAYENEAILAQRNGAAVDYIVPDQTILIENPIAVVSGSAHQQQARAFVDFLRTPQAQAIFAAHGYRPVARKVPTSVRFPQPHTLFDIGFLGGWQMVQTRFFDPQNGEVAQIERALGVAGGH
ncbi:MAG TPA: sulfate ABC transporter substrate-binding protein [Candidatus Eremiobacteraceae bacterium]|jgi:sulfate transport system substrate-binding protein